MNKEKEQKRVLSSKKTEEGLSYSVEVRDKEGRVIQRVSAPSRSYVRAWNQLLNVQFKYSTDTSIVMTNGNPGSIGYHENNLNCNAAAGIVLYGLRVGKGFTAVDITDYALETPCGEGVGVDEFNHQITAFTLPAVVGTTCSFTIKRILINNSGATISAIREIGMYIRLELVWYALGFRDVLPGGVTVPHGGSITVTYTIPVTV